MEDGFDLRRKQRYVKGLNIQQERDGSITISDLLQFEVDNEQACLQLLELGIQNRSMRETVTNSQSSRSHAIFQITMLKQQKVFQNFSSINSSSQSSSSNDKNSSNLKIAKLRIVDLAGSEKLSDLRKSKVAQEELLHINKSLTALGKCLIGLNQKKQLNSNKAQHIPYRQSKLTRILRDSLFQNSLIILIACVSPSIDCTSQTISTLKFAERAQRAILTHPNWTSVANRSSSPSSLRYRTSVDRSKNQDLRNEIKQLKDENNNLKVQVQRLYKIIQSRDTIEKSQLTPWVAGFDSECLSMQGSLKLYEKQQEKKNVTLVQELEEFKKKIFGKVKQNKNIEDLNQAFDILHEILKIQDVASRSSGSDLNKMNFIQDREKQFSSTVNMHSSEMTSSTLMSNQSFNSGGQQPRQKKNGFRSPSSSSSSSTAMNRNPNSIY